MVVQFKVLKFLDCCNRCTSSCPHIDDPPMESICNEIDKWILSKGKTIKTITNEDYEKAEALCENCDSFKPETN